MGEKRTRQRISCKIDELPEEVRVKVDVMLADTSNSYEYISSYLKEEGYSISKSSVGSVGRHFKWSGDCTVAANKNLPIKAVTHTACGKKGHAFFLA